MEVIYSILETILPFEFINYTFMKNALIAIILVSPIFAILGTMIVNNKMAFFSDALGHSAICGIAILLLLITTAPSCNGVFGTNTLTNNCGETSAFIITPVSIIS